MTIDALHRKTWGSIEKDHFDDMHKLLADMEFNKKWTHEKLLPKVYTRDIYGKITGELEAAEMAAKDLAKFMTRCKRDVVQAIGIFYSLPQTTQPLKTFITGLHNSNFGRG